MPLIDEAYALSISFLMMNIPCMVKRRGYSGICDGAYRLSVVNSRGEYAGTKRLSACVEQTHTLGNATLNLRFIGKVLVRITKA